MGRLHGQPEPVAGPQAGRDHRAAHAVLGHGQQSGGPVRAGLLPMLKHGMTGPVVATGLRAGDRLGLTVEPAHGSRRPTAPMILVLAL